jgi:hypothetical protein
MIKKEMIVLKEIVNDELRHSALAWRTVVWTISIDSSLKSKLLSIIDEYQTTTVEDENAINQLIKPLTERLFINDDIDWKSIINSKDVLIAEQDNDDGLEKSTINALLKTFQ